jgi:hypothetical protein
MSELQIFIIRHAEKPDPKGQWPGPGLTSDGEDDPESLVIRGWQRAGAWAALFDAGLGGTDYPAPAKIYAADPGAAAMPAAAGNGPSKRPYETATPLAERLGQSVDKTYAKGDECKLAKEVVALSGVVLICWEHKAIYESLCPDIAGAQKSSLKLPTDWPGDRFDVVLRFHRKDATDAWKFDQRFPMLMSGDSNTPLPT